MSSVVLWVSLRGRREKRLHAIPLVCGPGLRLQLARYFSTLRVMLQMMAQNFSQYAKCKSSTILPVHSVGKFHTGCRRYLALGCFIAFCLAALTDFFSRFSSPESFQLICGILCHHPPTRYIIHATVFLAEPGAKKKKSASWGVRVWQTWHDEKGILEMTCEELDRYIARFVQEAVKRDGKSPYRPLQRYQRKH